MALEELLKRPIYRLGLLMGLKAGTTDTAQAIEVLNGAARAATLSRTGFVINDAGVEVAIQRSFVNTAALGNTAVVAAQGAGIKIRVLAVVMVSTLAQTVKFQSATTDISAGLPVAANGGAVMPYNDHGWMQTNANEALNINLGVATATGVQVLWIPTA